MILILGNGFIGEALSIALVSYGYKVKVFSRNAGKIKDVDYRTGDWNSIDTHQDFFEDVRLVIQTIHTSVPFSSMHNILEDASNNILPNIKLLEILKEKKINHSIFISSGGAVYGTPNETPVKEVSLTNPISGYGVSKNCIENYINLYNFHHGLDMTIVRPSNIYGIGQDSKKKQGVISHLVSSIQNQIPFKLWGDGEGKKDYLYINDFVDALIKLIKNPPSTPKVYNISGGSEYTVNELISKVESAYDASISKEYLPHQSFDVPSIILNGNKFKSEYNWEPKLTIDEGIQLIIESSNECPK